MTGELSYNWVNDKITQNEELKMYYSFDVEKLRQDLKKLAKSTSYRHIEKQTGGALKRSKIGRLCTGEVIFGLRDFEIVVNLLNGSFDDYIFCQML